MSHLINRILRHYVVGIDIQREEARIVVLSYSWLNTRSIRFEYAARQTLPTGVYEGGEWISAADITSVCATLISDAKHSCQTGFTRFVMALPSNLVWVDDIEVHTPPPNAPRNADAAAWLNELEPFVLSQAEQALGLAAADIAADWFLQNQTLDPNHLGDPHRLTLVAAPRTAIEVRMECAAQLGMRLAAIDGEASAALRACRFAAAQEGLIQASYMTVWLGATDIEASLLYPTLRPSTTSSISLNASSSSSPNSKLKAPSTDILTDLSSHCVMHKTSFVRPHLTGGLLIDHLHTLKNHAMDTHTPKYLWFAGEYDAFHALETKGFSIKAIALALNCIPKRFNSTLYGLPSQKEMDVSHAQDPCFALAFGLALRGVFE